MCPRSRWRQDIYSRRFYDLYKVILKHNLKSIKLGKMAREDLKWWSNFCESFNVKRKIEYAEYPYPVVSDSSMRGLARGTCEGSINLETACSHIVSPPPPAYVRHNDPININELELWPILIGVKAWLLELKREATKKIIFLVIYILCYNLCLIRCMENIMEKY